MQYKQRQGSAFIQRLDMNARKIFFLHIALAAAAVVLDQVSKQLVLANLEPYQSHPVFGFFNLYLSFNRGAAFGMLADSSLDSNRLFLYASLAIIVLLLLYLRHLRPRVNQAATGIWLIVGGAAGNIIDRIMHGYVIDFIDFHYGGWHYSTFNLADTWITLGAILVALDLFNVKLLYRKHKNPAP